MTFGLSLLFLFQIVFDGKIGNGSHGDTAIDDVYIVDGDCTNATVVPPTDVPIITYPTFRKLIFFNFHKMYIFFHLSKLYDKS